MWRLLMVALSVSPTLIPADPPAPAPAPAPRESAPFGPDAAAAACLAFAMTLPAETRCHIFFLSWHGWGRFGAEALLDDQTFFNLVLNNCHFATAPVEFRPVPRCGGRVWWCDIREPNWNAEALRAVAARDGTFTDLTVGTAVAAGMRGLTGTKQDRNTLSLGNIVWAPGLLRDVIETDRSASYYDLLFGEQRFPSEGKSVPATSSPAPPPQPTPQPVPAASIGPRREKRSVAHGGGDFAFPDDSGRVIRGLAPGTYTFELEFRGIPAAVPVAPVRTGPAVEGIDPKPNPGKPRVDFPKTDKDWDDVFAVKPGRISATAGGRKVVAAKSAVVAGGAEDPRRGSVVARSNRLVVNAVGQWNWESRTFDVKDAAGKKNFMEQAAFIGSGKETPESDAHEFLATLPAGGIAMRVSDGAGNRLEITDPRVTRPARRFPRHPHLEHGAVRNGFIDCMACHLPDYGVINPQSLVRDVIRRGVGFEFADPADAVAFRGFFADLDRRVAGYREPHRELLESVTGTGGRKPWDGARAAAAIDDFVARYEAPVDRVGATAELGADRREMARIEVDASTGKLRLGGVLADAISVQAKQLVLGDAVPRTAFDRDVRPLLTKLMAASRAEARGDVTPNAILVPGVRP